MARFISRAHLLVSFLISCIINTTTRVKGEAREWFLLQNALPSSVRADVCRVIDWSIRLTGLYIIMQLHHKALRLFISVSVVVLTFSFLVYELIASDKAMNAYMRYINEKADSSFLYDKYTNQSIAAHLMRTFSSPVPASIEQQKHFATLSTALTALMGSTSPSITTCHYTVRCKPPLQNVARNLKTYFYCPLLTGR